MKTVQRKNLLRYALFAFVFVLALLVYAPFASQKSVSAGNEYESAFVGDIVIAEEYEIAYNGENIKAESLTVVYPSGGVYGGEKFTMTQAGIYTITYHATLDGQPIEETRQYMAVRMPQDVIKAEGDAKVEYGKYEVNNCDPYQVKNETYGAIVSLKAGQTFTFNTTVKTSKLTADYTILDMIVMPSVFKETDFEKLTVRVSDAINPDNYVEIVVISSNLVDGDGQISYVQAGANGQQMGGYEGATFHVNSLNYGTAVEHSFRALGRAGDSRKNHTVSERSLTISIDNVDKKVYCGPFSYNDDTKMMVNDLDDAANYKGNPWGGFTSDEVLVQVKADRFMKATGKVLVKSFGDYDFSTLVEDTLKPEILVNYDATQGLPIAEVGKNFPIFSFTAKDALDAQVKTNVYVYYLDARGQKITVETDGKTFFAKYAGTYQIVYQAEDYSGNVTEEMLEITAQEVMPNLYMAIEQPLVEAGAYQTVSIPLASEMLVFGGSGYLSVERNVYAPNNQVLDVEDSIQLTMLGDYKVVYSVTDYLGNVEYGVMTVRSMPVEKPVFIEEPTFDKVFINGFSYQLPAPVVIETTEGQVKELVCETYVNGKLTTDSFTASGEEMTIRYVANGVTGVSEWEETISVVDADDGKYKSKYFYTENEMEILDEKAYIELVFDETCGVEFVAPLYSQGFAVTLSYLKETTNFSTMDFVLTDAANKSNTVTIHFFYDASNATWFMQLNNGVTKISYVTSKDIFSFALSNDTKKIIDTSGIEIATITAYDNGKPFQGFSNMLYWAVSFDGVKDASSLRMTQLCNQPLGYNKSTIEKASDEINPVIQLNAPFVLRQKLGAKAQIPTAQAYDVLGQVVDFTITVEKNGALLAVGSATEGIDLTLATAGYYIVTYYAEDSNGNSESIPYTILVNDETAPNMTIQHSLKSDYKLNDVIKLPTYSVTDNGDNCYVQVTLILPNNELRLLQYYENGEITSFLSRESDLYESAFKANDNAFVALYKGSYVLRILAYDEYYNCTVQEFEFIVK